MWIIAEGGGGAVMAEGGAEVMAEDLSSNLERVSLGLTSDEESFGEGVEAAVSATDVGTSAICTS